MGRLGNVCIILALFFLAGYMLGPTTVQAQTPTPRFTHLTGEQGLSNNTVWCILQDAQGFMWFGTHDGLNKYDGYTFTVYQHRRSESDSLSEGTIYALYQDHAGTLWIGTPTGLDSFTGHGTQFTHHPAIGEQVNVIYQDAAGDLWIGTAGAGLFRREQATGQFVSHKHDPADARSLSDNEVISLYEDRAGTLWVGTATNGLDALDRDTGQFTHYPHDPANPHSLSYNRVTAIYQDQPGVLWIGTANPYEVGEGGLNVFDKATGQFTRYLRNPQDRHSLSSNHVKSIYEDQTGALWIGTDDGLNIFNRATSTFASYQHDPSDPHSLSSSRITTIYEDQSGALWFGTEDQGINQYARAKERFARYQHTPLDFNSLSDSPVGALYEDHTGILWIGTLGAGLDSLDRATGQFTHYTHDPNDPHSLAHNYVNALYKDHAGVLWVGTRAGLSRFDRATGHFTHFIHNPGDPNSLSQGAIKVILEDHTQTLWIGTEEPGNLNKFDKASGTFARYEYDPNSPSGFVNTYGVRAIYEDQAGDLWLGTYSGLVHFDRQAETFIQYRRDPQDPHSLSHDFVWSIYQDQTGIFWIATSGGLDRFDQSVEQFTVYTTENGLACDNVAGILADEQGNLWIGTGGGGLSRFDPQTETFRNYDVGDGLTSNTLLIAAHHQSKSGEMFFGADNGFNAFHPADVKDNPHLPPIVLTAFRKFDKLVEFDTPLSEVEEIALSYQDNFFAFEFAALDYTEPAGNQYAYRLEGFDRDWIYCGSRRYASYTNLPPGTFYFRVKGSNNDGVWNEAGQTVRIVVTPPPWQTWWFRVLAFALVSGIIAVTVRGRLRNIAVLRESEERFRTLFDNAPLCVFELDVTASTPRILRANQRSESVFGWPAAELAGALPEQIFPQRARPVLERTTESLRAGETIVAESAGLRRDGAEFPVRISAAREPGGGRAILVVEDVTAERERRTEEQAIAEERRRIAREIHDGLAQDLAGLRFQVGLWHKLVDADPPQMHAELDGLRRLLSKNIREVRRSIFALRPVALDELGFYPALCQFISEFGEQNQLHIDLQVGGQVEKLPAFLEPVLFRLIQESLNNTGKHAQASMVWILLDLKSPGEVALRIRDDGVGFDPATLEQAARRGHLGLKQMRERVENLKGTFELRSQPGRGTEIWAVVPLGGQ